MVRLAVVACLLCSSLAHAAQDAVTAPTMASAYRSTRNLGRGGTTAALVAWPVVLVGFGFTQTDTRFSVASGQALVGLGVASAVMGVPLMLYAGHRGARLIRAERPSYATPLLTVAWVLNGVSVVTGVLTAASARGDWTTGPPAPWAVRPTTFGVVSAAAGVAAFACARVQLSRNRGIVRSVDSERARQSVERAHPVQLWVTPTLTPQEQGAAIVGRF